MNVRVLAYRTLRRFEKEGRFPTEEVRDALSRLKERERAFFKELVWGVMRRQIYLDWVIDRFLKKPEIPPAIRLAIRLGAYQLLFMKGVPDYAAVNESVRMVQERSFRGLVNAVLRRIARKEFPKPKQLHIVYSHPKWISEYLVRHYGTEIAKRIMESHLKPSPAILRVNTLRFQRDDLLIMMEQEGIKAQSTPHSPHGIKVLSKGNPLDLPYVKRGLATVQGESSQLASLILDPKPFSVVLDMAAGCGGKTAHLAQLMENRGRIIALDPSFERIEILLERVRIMGIDIIETAVIDGRDAPAVFQEGFDYILLDTPCSSLGTARKNPDVMLTFSEERIRELANLQRDLLKAAWQLLKEGGRLLYVTCTFLKEENTEVVKELLEAGAKVVDVRNKLSLYEVDYHWDGVGALVLPDETATEMYYALLEKNSKR